MQARCESDVKLNALEASKVDAKVVQALEASKEAGSEEASNEGILSSTKLYIVIACIVALLFIALVQATCTIYRITRKPTQGTGNKVSWEQIRT